MPPRYRITQDRWCWCGAPAALLITRGKQTIEPVCSISHGQVAIEWLNDNITKEPDDG